MIKFAFMGALIVLCGFLGTSFSKVYDQKELFFEEFVEFLSNIKSEVSFFKTDIVSILKKYTFKSKLQKINQDITKLLENNENLTNEKIEEILNNYIIFEQQDNLLICQMYCELGNLGYVEQIEKLEYYINQFKISKEKNQNRALKMKPFCKKISILIGLLVCIVLL